MLALAALAMWRLPARPAAIPVSVHPAAPARPSWIDRELHAWHVSRPTLRAWFNQGLSLAGLVVDPAHVDVHVRQVAWVGLESITGAPLNNLPDLLRVEIPDLKAAGPPGVSVPTAKKEPRPKAQEEVDKSLPGDGGRVWAELGRDPIVGIYQTHSHESFWPYVPAGSQTAYSTDWSKTIVQVGWWLAEDLHQDGVAGV